MIVELTELRRGYIRRKVKSVVELTELQRGYIRREVKSVVELTEHQCVIMRKSTFFRTLTELQFLI